MSVTTGIDKLVKNNFVGLENKSLAVLINQSSVDSNFVHILEHFATRPDLKLKKIFAPEHGLFGGPQDMEKISSTKDKLTGVPVVSLYDGTTAGLAPSEKDLTGIEILVVDLPDVGSRYYTYAQTMALSMEIAGKTKTKVIVLDRPNPIDGISIEGSPLKKKNRSFCGMLTVPQRHGLTLGELAVMYQKGFGPKDDAYPPCSCDLEVIKCESWNRSHYLDEAKGTWVMPSPNMPTLDTAIVYPGGCLFEGTNISEARGTTLPFEFIGSPFIDGHNLAKQTLNEGIELLGATLRPICFIPKFQKWANQECGGVQIHVTDRKLFKPVRWNMALISAIARLYPGQFKWRTDTYEFIDNIPAIDLLYGSDSFRKLVDQKGNLSQLIPELTSFEDWFKNERKGFLFY